MRAIRLFVPVVLSLAFSLAACSGRDLGELFEPGGVQPADGDAGTDARAPDSATPDAAPTFCRPGQSQSCYDGPPGTAGVGTCVAGTKLCSAAGDSFGACVGQVVPVREACGNAADEDCNGVADNGCVQCGNNIKDDGETCDDGNRIDNDGCDSNCTPTGCGNGVKTGTEACDDGNMLNTDACTNACKLPACGDGFLQGAEVCDDGNAVNTDACTNLCKPGVCGDGIVRAGSEQCDDGNVLGNDGMCLGGPNNGLACGTATACPDGIQVVSYTRSDSAASAADDFTQPIMLTSAGRNRLLVVAVSAEHLGGAAGARKPSGIRFAGKDMTFAVSGYATSAGVTTTTSMYFLTQSDLPAAVGMYPLNVKHSFGANEGATYHVLQLDGVAEAPPDAMVSDFDITGADAFSMPFAINTPGSYVVDVIGTGAVQANGFTPTAGQTERGDLNALSSSSAIATYAPANTLSRNYTWTCNNDCNRSVHALVAFKPAPKKITCQGCDATCKSY